MMKTLLPTRVPTASWICAIVSSENEPVFPFLGGEEDACPLGRNLLALFDDSQQFLSLFGRHAVPFFVRTRYTARRSRAWNPIWRRGVTGGAISCRIASNRL